MSKRFDIWLLSSTMGDLWKPISYKIPPNQNLSVRPGSRCKCWCSSTFFERTWKLVWIIPRVCRIRKYTFKKNWPNQKFLRSHFMGDSKYWGFSTFGEQTWKLVWIIPMVWGIQKYTFKKIWPNQKFLRSLTSRGLFIPYDTWLGP